MTTTPPSNPSPEPWRPAPDERGYVEPPPAGYASASPDPASSPPYAPSPAGYGPPPGYAAAPPPARRPVKAWDVIVTVVLLVAVAIVAFFVSIFGFFLAMASDPCGARDCSTDLIVTGMLVAISLPWVVLIATVIVSIVRLVKRRIAFWVPIIGAVLIVGSWVLGAAIAAAGVPTG